MNLNHRVACLMAGLALAAGPCTVMSASPVRHSVGDVDNLVDGAPQPRFAHDGRWYVEARKGREYAIRLRNPYAVRAAVALSVDGLNTIDARETTAAEARKWVLGPYETVTMGRRAGHTVVQVWLDLEDAPAQTLNIRYEFHPQLVRLGILPAAPTADPLVRREGAHGFAPSFGPEPPRQR